MCHSSAVDGRRCMVTPKAFEIANESANELHSRVPKAISAKYDRRIRRIVVRLSSNLGIFFSPRDAEGLEHATPEQLTEIDISPSGYGLHFPKLDADLYLPSLLDGVFGSEQWTARRTAMRVVKSRTQAKRTGTRENVKKNGRSASSKQATTAHASK